MKDISKKILSFALAVTCVGAVGAFTGCGADNYTKTPLTGYETTDSKAESNGGFAVKKDGYVYFINGMEDSTASNEYGEVEKGSLMRIAETDLADGKYDKAETVVPMLFVAQNFSSGIYIYGDYVYFATPTTDKNMQGDVESSWIDFKRAKLDGSETMKNYYFRLENNASVYRFVEDKNGVVYCVYENTDDNGTAQLVSYNTATDTHTVLVKGAKSSFFYDTKDLSNGVIYYTMAVTKDMDTDYSSTLEYDQLYSVNAWDTVTVDTAKASYTTAYGKTYDFDEKFLEKKNKEFKDDEANKGKDAPYDLKDYTTYPYVNLGKLVLDGVGRFDEKTEYNFDTTTNPATAGGYNYTITAYQNGGVYFTRTDLPKTDSATENTSLYYLADATANADGWNAISGNATPTEVASNTTNASATAYYTVKDGAHTYYYIANGALYRQSGSVKTTLVNTGLTDNTLLQMSADGKYLYFYGAGTNGKNLSRINVTGTQDDYNLASIGKNNDEYQASDEFRVQTLSYIDWNDSWYKPEFFGDTVLYSGAQSFGDTSYNYVYATKFGSTESVKAQNNGYKAVKEYIDDFTDDGELQNAMTYYFRTGKTAVYDSVKADVYDEKQQEKFTAFVNKFAGETPEFKLESAYIGFIGAMKADDSTAIDDAWTALLTPEEETTAEDDDGLATWAIVLIVVGSVLVVATAVLVPLLIVRSKKKAKQREEEATVNAYKRQKIDTTDEKSIDVYADEERETAEETVEETTENTTETVEETASEEVVETEQTEAEKEE